MKPFILHDLLLCIYHNRTHRISLNPEQPFIGQQFLTIRALGSVAQWHSGYRPLHLVSVIFGYSEIKSCRCVSASAEQLCLYAFLLHCAQRTCTYGCWQCNSERRQIASGLSRSNSADPPQFHPPLSTRNSSLKAGKRLGEVIKDVPLYLNSIISTLFIQKRGK